MVGEKKRSGKRESSKKERAETQNFGIAKMLNYKYKIKS
jgi:hypothetical protein